MQISAVPEGYRVLGERAPGPWGVEFVAEDVVRGGRVTLTPIGPGVDRVRLARELDVLAGLRHPGIVAARLVTDGTGGAWVVGPHAGGPDLAERLATWGPLPPAAAVHLVGRLAGALDAAHRAGIVHGGLRPAVVRFGPNDQAVLTGFGVAGPPAANAAPEQVVGAAVDHRADVHALGALLYGCLTGQVPPPTVHADPPRVSAVRPGLPPLLDGVVATAMARDPALRFPSCPAMAEAAAAAVRTAPGRRVRWQVLVAVLAVVALAAAGVVAAPRIIAALRPTADDLARVPAALQGNCELADPDPRLPAAQRVLRCSAHEQDVLIGLFADEAAADAAYQGVVTGSPGARRATGDCAHTGAAAEHRFPGLGEVEGRVLCARVGQVARLSWTDRSDRVVGVAERTDGDLRRLYRTWEGWVQLPAFPTPPEQELLGVLYEDRCERAPAGPLEALDGVVAAVECRRDGPEGGRVTYYRFADRDSLGRAFAADVGQFGARPGVVCLDRAGPEAGEAPYYRTGITVGRATCGKDGTGKHTVTWTDDGLLVLARASGPDRAALIDWWSRLGGPTLQASIDAVNRQSRPAFPNADEAALIARIPVASRSPCTRPDPGRQQNHVGAAAVVGIACAAMNVDTAYFYAVRDSAALEQMVGPGNGPDCTTVAPGAPGSARYTRPNGSTGVLTCAKNEAGTAYLVWSDEQAGVLGVAFHTDPAALLRWWQDEADVT